MKEGLSALPRMPRRHAGREPPAVLRMNATGAFLFCVAIVGLLGRQLTLPVDVPHARPLKALELIFRSEIC